MLNDAESSLSGLDTVLIAHGTLSDQKACESSVELTLRELTTNGLSVVALLTSVAARFEQRRAGTIVVISSVAGDRGRQSNYVYGSAKALVTAFTSGLRQRLYASGVAVVTIKPGFVDTPMTAAFPKGALWAKPQKIANGIVAAVDGGAATVLYLPAFWRLIMFVIRSVPEAVFRRLKL
jgi:decaprenylphospho-beta-D-erythro-pentofuranosid-2-ulose 2-reductase